MNFKLRRATLGRECVVLDFETYYCTETGYSLGKYTYEAYIRDPQFEALICSFYLPERDELFFAVGYDDIAYTLKELDLTNKAVMAYNASFDSMVLFERFGIEAAEYIDPLSMIRPFLGIKQSVSLNSVCKILGLGVKGEEVLEADGKRLSDFTSEELDAYSDYCVNDAFLCWKVFAYIRRYWDHLSMEVISESVRCSSVARLTLDVALLEKYVASIARNKMQLFIDISKDFNCSVESTLAILGSTVKLDKAFKHYGVLAPVKVSDSSAKKGGPIKYIPAFAKKDEAFLTLLDHPDERVRRLAEGRLALKAATSADKAERYLAIGERGAMPFPITAFGATTSRWTASGGQQVNVQNIPKRSGDTSVRRSIKAPDGYSVVTCDLSQIEARRMAANAGQNDLTLDFMMGIDVYSVTASELYRRPITKADYKERNVGKGMILSLQYGASAERLYQALTQDKLDVSLDLCTAAVALYRKKYSKIVDFWKDCQKAVNVVVGAYGSPKSFWFGHDGQYVALKGRIILPDGFRMQYPEIKAVTSDEGYPRGHTYYDRKDRADRKFYRGIVANNVTQGSAARILQGHISELRTHGLHMVGTVHDELIFIIKNEELVEKCGIISSVMSKAPSWAPMTPVGCELTVGENYADQYDLDDFLAGGMTTEGTKMILEEKKRNAIIN